MSESVKRAYDPGGTRRRILDAAAEAFQANGYHATSMHDVMRQAGVPGGSLYHHFPTKKRLGLAVIEERVAREVDQTWIEPIARAASAREGVLSVFEATVANRSGEITGCPLNNLALELSLAEPDFQAALRRVFYAWKRAVADRLRADVAAGTIEDVDAEALASLIVASYSGAMAMAKASQEIHPIRACARELARILP